MLALPPAAACHASAAWLAGSTPCAARQLCRPRWRRQLRCPPVCLPAGNDLSNNGLGTGAAAAALTFAVPAARLLATDRSRRRLGNRVKVGVCLLWEGAPLCVRLLSCGREKL